jgi:hypothetical protein
LREVPVPDPVVDRLKACLSAPGLHPEPDDLGNRGAHLLGRHDNLVGQAAGREATQAVGAKGLAICCATSTLSQLRSYSVMPVARAVVADLGQDAGIRSAAADHAVGIELARRPLGQPRVTPPSASSAQPLK